MSSDNETHHAATQSLIADVPTPAMPAWAPDGSAVAYLWDDGAGWELWVAGAAGQGARQLATGALLSVIDWTRDGAEIVFVRRVEGGSAIAAVNLAGDVRQITSGPRDRSPQVSPDGSTVAFLSGRAGAFDVWKAPLAGGAATQLTERTNPLDEPRWTPRWSPDGGWLSYVSSRSGERNNDDLWIVSADGRENRQLTTGLIVDTDPIWSPDGNRLAVVANTAVEHWYGDDLDLWLVALDDVRPRRVTSGGGVTRKLDGSAVAWSPDGRFVYCLNHLNGDTNLASVRVEDGLLTRVTNHDGVVSDFTLSPIGDAFAIVIAGQTAPPELAVLAIDGGLAVPLTNSSSRVTAPVTAPIRMPFQSYDGIYCDAYLYLPAGFSAGRQFPALVQVHGGGTNSFGNGWHPIEQFLAQRGFIVFAVEYRGSSGYGRDFAGLSYADWGGGQTLDAIAAADFLKSKSYVSGVGIYGGSYGGYLSLHAVVAAPDAFGAAADLYGITNRFDYFDRSDRVGRVFVTRDYGGRGPVDAPDLYLRASTHHRLSEIRTPLLVLHGSEDTRVPPVQSEAVVEQLGKHGIEHEYVVYPGEGHGFRKREHRIDAYERLARWFERHLASEQPQ
ncbi:MAG TPA: prolyl oligopeptidase family serine peptidase [Thermomicrobiales bacterium]|nr:prolyl oligopeptidase family serine peptidase [Thermomicrobiales bacterium]